MAFDMEAARERVQGSPGLITLLIALRESQDDETSLDEAERILAAMTYPEPRKLAAKYFRLLEEVGAGAFIVGRRGRPSRFSWAVWPVDLLPDVDEEDSDAPDAREVAEIRDGGERETTGPVQLPAWGRLPMGTQALMWWAVVLLVQVDEALKTAEVTASAQGGLYDQRRRTLRLHAELSAMLGDLSDVDVDAYLDVTDTLDKLIAAEAEGHRRWRQPVPAASGAVDAIDAIDPTEPE